MNIINGFLTVLKLGRYKTKVLAASTDFVDLLIFG